MPPSSQDAVETQPQAVRRSESWLKIFGDYLAMAGGLSYWGFFGLIVTIVATLLGFILPRRIGQRVGQKMIHELFRIFVVYLEMTRLVYADLSELKQLGKQRSAFILAPNHTSLWDVVFILACSPRTVCVIKESILKNPVLGGGARLAGYIPNDSIKKMIQSASTALSEENQLLLFPEGTRTAADQRWINPLKGGCSIIATRNHAAVYPIFIRSDTRFLQKGWPLWRRPHFPIRMHFEVGPMLQPRPEESPQEFTERLQNVYEQELSRPHPLRRTVVQKTAV